jgi:linoleoyl-CoA desaturase
VTDRVGEKELTTTAGPNFGSQVMGRVRGHLGDDVMEIAYRRLHRKGLLVVAWYAASYALVIFGRGWIVGTVACCSLALSMVAVGFNIQHDANHNAFFRTSGQRRLSTANRIAGLSIHAIGGSSKRWIEGHVYRHHAAPNVVGKDSDVDLAPFARLAPAQRHRWWHAFQHLYLWVIYAFTTASIIIGDVVATVQESIAGDRKGKSPTFGDYAVLLGSKGLFAVAVLVVPLLLHPWWVVALGAGVVLGISGWLLGIVFQLAHVVDEADFCATSDRAKVRWHEWQVLASVDFIHGRGAVARVFTWYAGGLNFQTEHHLFPGLPHTVYPTIAPIVAQTCEEFGIRYQVQPTLRAAIRSHYRHVRELGRPLPVAEAA